MISRPLSKTEKMWMARIAKGHRELNYRHDAVHRLVGRGIAKVETRVDGKGNGRRILSKA